VLICRERKIYEAEGVAFTIWGITYLFFVLRKGAGITDIDHTKILLVTRKNCIQF
jgi:hypothetical protein